MSWSVSATGKPAAVKREIEKQFAQCLPHLAQNEPLKHEHASAALAKESIEAQMNFLIDNQIPCAVRVEAAGSAWLTPPSHGYTSHNLKVELLPSFVE